MTKTYKYFGCCKRHCNAINPDYLAFGVGINTDHTYCLHHIPRYIKVKMWLRGTN